jgi:integrase
MHSLGYRYVGLQEFFDSVSKHLGDKDISKLTSADTERFLAGRRTSSSTWNQNYHKLRLFFQYFHLLGRIRILPLPRLRPAEPKEFIPYIYSQNEIRKLTSYKVLNQTLTNANKLNVIEPDTFRTFLLFLYGTGVSVNEALNLRWEDVDLRRGIISVSRYNGAPRRTIPIGTDVHKLLMQHRPDHGSPKDFCFASKHGTRIAHSTLVPNFRHVRDCCGIVRPGGKRYQARMHDLRHTFAVHRITQWLEQGIDPEQHIAALAAYMGHVGLSVRRYLLLCPEHYRAQMAPSGGMLVSGLRGRKKPDALFETPCIGTKPLDDEPVPVLKTRAKLTRDFAKKIVTFRTP